MVFQSDAFNLGGGYGHLYVRDRCASQTVLVTVATDGTPASGGMGAYGATISPDGSCVAFNSDFTNLVPVDVNSEEDVFVRDLATGTTMLISISADGIQADDGSYGPSVSADCMKIAFQGSGTNLVADDTNDASDVFIAYR